MTSELPPQTPPYQPPTPPAPPAQTQSSRGSGWRWGCALGLAGCLVLVVIGALIVLAAVMRGTGAMDGISMGGGRIALIRVDGMLVSGRSGFSLLGGAATGSDDIVEQIERALDDSEVKGILLRINSPGGSAAAAQEVYQAVKTARRKGRVVVASMADMAASGGYYVAAPADKIYANPATVTGSIGAIAMHDDISGLLDKLGVAPEVIKSGKLKDMFAPTQPLSDEAREVMKTLVEQVHEQFIQAVVEGRRGKLDEATVRKLADGRIYSGQQAKENGLVDELGGYQDALSATAGLAGLRGKPSVKEYGAPSLLRWLLGGASARRVAVSGGLLYDDFAARVAGGGVEPMVRPGER